MVGYDSNDSFVHIHARCYLYFFLSRDSPNPAGLFYIRMDNQTIRCSAEKVTIKSVAFHIQDHSNLRTARTSLVYG